MNRRQFVMSTAIGTLSLSLTAHEIGATQATPGVDTNDPWVIGDAFRFLATEGDQDTLFPVVEPRMFDNSSYVVVLRSFYSSPVAISDVYGTVRDKSGSLIATVEDSYYAPAVIEPNGVCIVGVSFDSELSSSERNDADVALDYDSTLDVSDSYEANLLVTDFSVRSDRIIGVVENPNESEVSFGWIVAVWFDGDGQISGWFSTTTDKMEISAGGMSTFSRDLSQSVKSDRPYLAAARGNTY